MVTRSINLNHRRAHIRVEKTQICIFVRSVLLAESFLLISHLDQPHVLENLLPELNKSFTTILQLHVSQISVLDYPYPIWTSFRP